MMQRQLARPNVMLQGVCRTFHVMTRSARLTAANETPVPIYSSPDFEQLKALGTDSNFGSNMLRSNHKRKVFSLVPFFVEAAFTSKHFVSRMQLYPQAGLIGIDILTMDGIQTQFLPINQMIPVTKYDYWAASWRFWTKQNTILDLDMIYANRVSKEMYVFEKTGQWHDEGVNHEALSMEKTFNEAHWYDGFNVHTM